jgi:hypothetical protein
VARCCRAGSAGGWFGTTFATPLDLSGKSNLKVDLRTTTAGTSVDIAVQTGDAFTWCQGNFTFYNAGTTTTFDADLNTAFSCPASSLTQVHTIYIFFNSGPFDLDFVRAE